MTQKEIVEKRLRDFCALTKLNEQETKYLKAILENMYDYGERAGLIRGLKIIKKI